MCGKGASFPFLLPLSDLAMGLECVEKEEVNCKGKGEEARGGCKYLLTSGGGGGGAKIAQTEQPATF